MRNFLIGVAAGALTTYVIYKLAQEGKLDFICDDMSKIADKTKMRIKNGLDIAQNNVEYLEDRLKHKTEEVKEVIDEITSKISSKPHNNATS